MALAVLNILVALFLGYGAVDELINRGIRGGEVQPFVLSLVGIVASLLLAVSGIALWRRWPNARRLAIVAAALLIAMHAYGALPPHRNVGILALVVAVGYGLVLLGITLSSGGRKAREA